MRQLTKAEVPLVGGGIGVVGAVIGGVANGYMAYHNGHGAGVIAGAVAVGAVSGFFGGIASATTGIARVMFGAYAIETGVIGGFISGSTPTRDRES